MIIEIEKLKCNKCKHQWVPRKAEVRMCPKCKTAYWECVTLPKRK